VTSADADFASGESSARATWHAAEDAAWQMLITDPVVPDPIMPEFQQDRLNRLQRIEDELFQPLDLERLLRRWDRILEKQWEDQNKRMEKEFDRMQRDFEDQERRENLERIKEQQKQDQKDAEDNLKRSIEEEFQRKLQELDQPKPRRTSPMP
jgi:hypothetical protein